MRLHHRPGETLRGLPADAPEEAWEEGLSHWIHGWNELDARNQESSWRTCKHAIGLGCHPEAASQAALQDLCARDRAIWF